jgi:hypothetical protein
VYVTDANSRIETFFDFSGIKYFIYTDVVDVGDSSVFNFDGGSVGAMLMRNSGTAKIMVDSYLNAVEYPGGMYDQGWAYRKSGTFSRNGLAFQPNNWDLKAYAFFKEGEDVLSNAAANPKFPIASYKEMDHLFKYLDVVAWTICIEGVCGPRAPSTRIVACYEVYPALTGWAYEGPQRPEYLCPEKPPMVRSCDPILPGSECDDYNAATSEDTCTAFNTCAGKEKVRGGVTYDNLPPNLDFGQDEEGNLPNPNEQPMAESFKDKTVDILNTKLTESITPDNIIVTNIKYSSFRRLSAMTGRRLSTGKLDIEYVVELPVSESTGAKKAEFVQTLAYPQFSTDANGNALSANAMTIDLGEVKDTSGNTVVVVLAAPTVEPMVTYSYYKIAYSLCFPSLFCSVFCDAVEISGADTYTCITDGNWWATVPASECERMLGPQPTSKTICCPPADIDQCIPPDIVPTPEPTPEPTAADCYGTWAAWSSCSETCGGGGYKHRRFHVIEEEAFGGKPCDTSDYSASCWAGPCPVDCEGHWGKWGACMASCGDSMKFRQFNVTTPGAMGGKGCPEEPQMTKCNKGACPTTTPKSALRLVKKNIKKAANSITRKKAKEDARAAEKAANKAARMSAKEVSAKSGKKMCSSWCTKNDGQSDICEWEKCKECEQCKSRRLFQRTYV